MRASCQESLKAQSVSLSSVGAHLCSSMYLHLQLRHALPSYPKVLLSLRRFILTIDTEYVPYQGLRKRAKSRDKSDLLLPWTKDTIPNKRQHCLPPKRPALPHVTEVYLSPRRMASIRNTQGSYYQRQSDDI